MGIVTLIWFYLQILISFCKFLMSKPLKWGILGDSTIIIFKVTHKSAWKHGKLFYELDISCGVINILSSKLNDKLLIDNYWQNCRNVVTSAICSYADFDSWAFCVITFEPIEVQTCSAPQNDRLNLSFVKDIYVDGGNLAWNGCKTAISQSTYLWDTLYLDQFGIGGQI